MIGTLLRQDPVFRGLPILLAVGLFAGSLFRAFTVRYAGELEALTGQARGWAAFSVGVVWFSCLMIVLSNNFMTRTSRLAMSLPLPGRTLWWVRMISILYSGVLPVALATMIVALRVPPGGGAPVLHPYYLLLGGKVAALLVLAAFLFQSPQPQLQRVRASGEYILYVVVVSILLLVLAITIPAHPVSVLVPLGISALLAIRLHRRVPESFLLVPTEPDGSDWAREAAPPERTENRSADTAAATPAEPPLDLELPEIKSDRILLHWMLFRLLVNHWQTWLFAPMIAFYAFLFYDGYHSGRDVFANVMFVVVWPFILSFQSMIRLHRVDHLPIHRRTQFPYIVLPGLLCVLLGLGIGALFYAVQDQHEPLVRQGECCLEVAPEFWEIAWDGQPPRQTSPWGESLVPTAHQLFPGSRVKIYLPYETTSAQSDRFAALQAGRAVEAVHGATPPAGGDALEFSVGRGSPTKARTWLLGAIVVAFVSATLGALGMLQFRPGRFRKLYQALFISLVVAWAVALATYVFSDMLGYHDPRMTSRFLFVLLRYATEALPLGNGALWLILAGSMASTLLLIGALFRGVEAPLGKVRPVWREYG